MKNEIEIKFKKGKSNTKRVHEVSILACLGITGEKRVQIV